MNGIIQVWAMTMLTSMLIEQVEYVGSSVVSQVVSMFRSELQCFRFVGRIAKCVGGCMFHVLASCTVMSALRLIEDRQALRKAWLVADCSLNQPFSSIESSNDGEK